jgi:hypothetical protein
VAFVERGAWYAAEDNAFYTLCTGELQTMRSWSRCPFSMRYDNYVDNDGDDGDDLASIPQS